MLHKNQKAALQPHALRLREELTSFLTSRSLDVAPDTASTDLFLKLALALDGKRRLGAPEAAAYLQTHDLAGWIMHHAGMPLTEAQTLAAAFIAGHEPVTIDLPNLHATHLTAETAKDRH